MLSSKVRQLNDAVAAETGKDRVFAKTLPAVVMAMFRHFEAHHGFFEIFVRERVELSRGAPQTEGVLAEIEAGTRQMTEWIAAAQRAGAVGKGKPRSLAQALRGMVFQFTRDWLRGGSKGRLTQHAAFVTGFFLKGAGA